MKNLSLRGKAISYRAIFSSVAIFFGSFFVTYFVASLNNPVGESYADTVQYVETLPPALSVSVGNEGAGSAARNLAVDEAPAVSSEARDGEIVYTVIYTR